MKYLFLSLLLNLFLIPESKAYLAEQKDFVDYCEEGRSSDSADGIKYTVQRLLWTARSEDCKQAYQTLKTLTVLKLQSDPEGGHQISDLRPLQGLGSLRHLDLGNNLIKDLSPLGSLKNLSTLSLRGNRFELDLKPLSSLNKLISLDLSWVRYRSIQPLLGLTRLQSLGISNGRSFSLLSQLSLAKLEVSNGDLNENFLRPISDMNSLKSLKIWVGRSRSQAADIDTLRSLRNLERLEFRDAWKLKDISVVANMKKLEVFAAPFSSISDLSPLVDLKDLKTLNLRVNKIPANQDYCPTERGPEVLKKYCRKLIGRFGS